MQCFPWLSEIRRVPEDYVTALGLGFRGLVESCSSFSFNHQEDALSDAPASEVFMVCFRSLDSAKVTELPVEIRATYHACIPNRLSNIA